MSNKYSILLTIDVEDWFQVENFKECIPFSSWPSCELRVEANTHRILDILDSQRSGVSGQQSILTNSTHSLRQRRIGVSQFHPRLPSPGTGGQEETENKEKSNKSSLPYEMFTPCSDPPTSLGNHLFHRGKSCLTTTSSPKATFFVLGWIAERLPHLVREIHARGHEVASHGYYHNLCTQESPDALKKDLSDSKKLLEDIIGAPVFGYRAPSFAINHDILKVVEDCDYLYDSSHNSFAMHGRYGRLNLSRNGRKGIALKLSDNFYELPISNMKVGTHIFPWGGGGYFRLLPFYIFKKGLEAILRRHNTYLLYIHPWEIDPEQPRVAEAPAFYRFRHYVNLNKTHSKLTRFFETFSQCRFTTCYQYLEHNLGKYHLDAGTRY